jgi:hypothetical protein
VAVTGEGLDGVVTDGAGVVTAEGWGVEVNGGTVEVAVTGVGLGAEVVAEAVTGVNAVDGAATVGEGVITGEGLGAEVVAEAVTGVSLGAEIVDGAVTVGEGAVTGEGLGAEVVHGAVTVGEVTGVGLGAEVVDGAVTVGEEVVTGVGLGGESTDWMGTGEGVITGEGLVVEEVADGTGRAETGEGAGFDVEVVADEPLTEDFGNFNRRIGGEITTFDFSAARTSEVSKKAGNGLVPTCAHLSHLKFLEALMAWVIRGPVLSCRKFSAVRNACSCNKIDKAV